ncbi:hypothetical protein LG200_05690 [Methylobacillus caricis]|uniref:hypothetical protein n=1 Tax=Methylobacillus caricis TaxID=1971611 RepID=UPI001CFFF33F|nr:hypothetical protein [Methylobacillus caricis]MCB5187498.1 hypothetical protein [Methylobacillus caricis]
MNIAALTHLQLEALNEVRKAEQEGREAVIADGLRDFLVDHELILPDMNRHHRVTEKAKSLLSR